MKKLLVISIAIGYSLVSSSQTTTASGVDKNCHREPNGDKIWDPATIPYYPDGYKIIFDGIPKVCVAGKWEYDVDTANELERINRPRQDLLRALKTRPLTKEELVKLNRYGSHILVTDGQPYLPSQIDSEFAALLKVQELMQLANKCTASSPPLMKPESSARPPR